MNEENRERLSAFMDDELSPAQAQRLLDAMRQDDELCQFWQSAQLISAALHGETMAMADRAKGDKARRAQGIADRVREALAAEPAILAPTPATRRRSLGPMGGLALAASVAMVAVIATQQALLNRQRSAAQTVAGTTPTAAADTAQLARLNDVPGPLVPVSAGTQRQRDGARSAALTRMTWNDAGPGVEARLNAYLLNHNEFTVGGVRGMLPYARIVGYGPTQ